MRILLAKSRPCLGRPPNNRPQLATALVYLDLSSSSSSNSSRIPKANKEIPGHLETNRPSGRRTQPNLNRVDVSHHLRFTHLGSSINTKQYLALLRLNNHLQGCLVAQEVACLEIRNNRVPSSKAANHPHLVCSETRQRHLHQVVADSLVIMPLARRQVHPSNPVFLAMRSDNQPLSLRTMPLREVPSSVAPRHLLPV